ncbi:MAG: 2-C-methyl-D-erythritol 2,4-cyclodiphosphate synthase [Desulfatiglans sp.]|jgi:2-C-methyl-D-erythritol 2,4-cyclodiphosphate synthase|nr:2-C-methyl-D-erythritol 2,4-cyclodiphosphate synthase [Desulfatiglans sp.]
MTQEAGKEIEINPPGQPLFRIGFGYDVHPFVPGRPLILGGVDIDHPAGLKGHSDADVLTHAVMDALLGALARGDIGRHFPDTDPAWKGIKSLLMLERLVGMAKDDGYRLNNLDVTVVAQRPRLAPHLPLMRERLSEVFEASTSRINVKATTTERLGFVGREEGISAFAVISLVG